MNAYSGGAAAAAAIAAAQRKKMQEEEEERLTGYTKEDLTQGWEFKIVRSNTAIRGEKFNRLCKEEAQNGWELVEKFDDKRVRFKRSVAKRANDHSAYIDPYRTLIGLSEGAIVGIVLGITGAVVAILFLLLT